MDKDKFVFRIVEDKAVLTRIKIGQRQDGEVEIVDGLHEEDRVIIGGQMKIFDGAPVTVINQANAQDKTSTPQGS
jgi:membrane fusion protein (multidrug efflux system)